MPSTIVQLVFGVAFGLIAYLALENSEQLKSIITPRSQEQESRIPKCQTISGLIVYRYSVPHTFPNFTTCDLEFDSFKKQMREVVNDQTIERLVTMHGYPIESTSQVIGHEEIIALNGEEKFMWPGKFVGYKTNIELDGRQITVTTASANTPRLLLVDNFLSDEECDHMVEVVKKMNMEQSKIGETADVSVYDNVIRTSTNTWVGPLTNSREPVFDRIMDRVFNFTHMPADLAEDFQVVHYDPHQHFYVHHDYNDPGSCVTQYCKGGGNRYLTFLMYLNNVPSGGETTFPYVGTNRDPTTNPIPYSSKCGEGGLRVKPKKGMCVLFYSLHEQGMMTNNVDPTSLHAGCDVLEGEKWAANLWIRNKRVNGKLIDDNW